MFVSVVTTITDKNLTDMGILTMFAVLYVALGCVFGILIVKVAAPPFNFRNSTVKATSMGNWGDLTLAIITGVGNQEP